MSVLKAMLQIINEDTGQDVKITSPDREKIVASHIEDDLKKAGIKFDEVSVEERYQGRVPKYDRARFQVFGEVTEEDIDVALGGDYEVEFE